VNNSRCRGYLKGIVQKNKKKVMKPMCRNRVYRVDAIYKSKVVLVDSSKRKYTIMRKQFDQHFELPYCLTNHSAIGLTIDEPVTIFDVNEYNVDQRWFWTAITRTTSLKYISIYTGPPITNTSLRKYVLRKLNGHKQYDEKNGVYDQKKFVTVNWVMKELERLQWHCSECGVAMEQGKGNHQWSIDRVDNSLGHTISNCRVICLSCNKGKH